MFSLSRMESQMAIKVTPQPDVYVTEEEFRRFKDLYNKSFTHYVGPPPSLEEFIRQQKTQRVYSALASIRE